jgi:hypothetical protein
MRAIRSRRPIFAPIIRICAFLTDSIYVGRGRFVQVDGMQLVGFGDVEGERCFFGEVFDYAAGGAVECASCEGRNEYGYAT